MRLLEQINGTLISVSNKSPQFLQEFVKSKEQRRDTLCAPLQQAFGKAAEMAELGAGVAIAAAISKLGQFLHEQASFLFDIRDKIERLKKELSWMQSFLQDAEKKLDNDDSLIGEWVSDVRDLAYECEDVIDTFLLKLSRIGETQPSCIGTMSRCFVAYTAKFRSTYELGCEIEKLMTKVNDISSRRERYGLDAADVFTTSNSNNWEKKLMHIRMLDRSVSEIR